MHLAYDLLEGWDALVLVDALPSRGSPGTLHVFEADHESLSTTAGLDAHAMDPAAVFASLVALGGAPPPTLVIGCEVSQCRGGHRAVRGRGGRGAPTRSRRSTTSWRAF